MTDLTKTLLAIVIAAVLVGAAAVTRPTALTDARFSDQGELFFANFTDPLTPASLEVVSFDAASASFEPFKVEKQDGRWVIPSHHNYPADAAENMAKAASAFIGLAKEQVVSDRAADHEALGVLAPDDPHAPLSGRGTRVTLRDANGGELASLIIGSTAPSPSGEQAQAGGAARRYVRVPDKARVYAVNFPAAFSTSFADWVETDLLKLEGKRIDRLMVDRYEVDERAAERRSTERLTLSRVLPPPIGAEAAKWTIDCQPPASAGAGATINETRIDEALQAFADLKIVGVRAKPPALAAALAGDGSPKVGQAEFLDLQARGFFVTRDGKFVANEGEATVTAEDGVVYNIAFGEVLFGRDEEISAGVDQPEGADGDTNSGAAGTESRYVLVRVSFDPTRFPEITPPPAPEPAAAPAEGEAPSEPAPADEAAKREYERQVSERDAKISAGKARADALTRRFANWYYVIDAKSYAALRPTCAEVTAGPAPASQGVSVGPTAPGS
jgi:hypothetical protein